MKKSLIALAVAGVFAAPVAMAETTVYGQANISYDSINNGDNGAANGAFATAVNAPAVAAAVGAAAKAAAAATTQQAYHATARTLSSNASRLGFKGTENLGDGVVAVWQLEEQINFASSGSATSSNNINNPLANGSALGNNTTTFSSRDTFVGLSSGDYGTLIGGIHDTPYKMATRGYDLFADTIADNRSIMGANNVTAALGDVRLNNVAAYISPSFSGLTLAIATIAGAEVPVAPSSLGSSKGTAVSFAALYGNGPFTANFGWQTVTVGSNGSGTLGTGGALATGDNANFWKLGGGYSDADFAVNAVYEKEGSSGGTIGNGLDRTSFYVGGKYNLDAMDDVKAAVTVAGDTNSVANTGARQFSLGMDHGLSKSTSFYALYSKINNSVGGTYQLGNPDANSNTASVNGGTGSAPSVISMGLKHSF